jgi:predicted dehydrogenase
MLKLGLVDFDTSHVVQFSKRINHVGIAEDQWVEGGRVTLGYAGASEITPQETIDRYVAQCREECGVELVDRPEELLGRVDAVFVESQGGGAHLERARPFLETGLPVFIDKPYANSVEDAKAIARLAREKGAPVFSASSLRYALEIQEIRSNREERGGVCGAEACSPGSLHPKNPGMLHYGIHAVETLYALMGPGCRSVSCASAPTGDVATGVWDDGRIGSVRAIRQGAQPFAFAAYCEKGLALRQIDANFIYRELLKRIMEMFRTGEAPLDIRETIEIIAFIDAARLSSERGGVPVDLEDSSF